MPKIELAPTKSNLLTLKHQLSAAEEGYDLLEQKRQVLVVELLRRSIKGKDLERSVGEALRLAYLSQREAALSAGSYGIDRTALAVSRSYQITRSDSRLMGLLLPGAGAAASGPARYFGLSETSASMDLAMRRFTAIVPPLVELAALQTTIQRLARELMKTQRRCNALSRIFLPSCREAITRIRSVLNERERESLVMLKKIRDNARAANGG